MPSISAGGKSASWHLELIISAFPRIRVSDNLPKSWPVTSPSSSPLHLANTAASCFTWATAPGWRPPRVSIAKGRRTRPCRRQASAVSLIFLSQAFKRDAPAFAAAPATFVGQRGPVTGEISSDLDRTKKMMENLNIIQISHLTFDCSWLMVPYDISITGPA